MLAVGAYIFSELGDTAKDAIEPLLEIAEDVRRDRTARCGAIRAVGSIGPAAAPVVGRLKAIAARDPEAFEESVTRAMVHVGGAAAIEGRQAEARAQERCRTKGTSEATRSRDALEALDRRMRSLEVGRRPAPGRRRASLASRVALLPARRRAGGPAGVRAPAVPADLVGGRGPGLADLVRRPASSRARRRSSRARRLSAHAAESAGSRQRRGSHSGAAALQSHRGALWPRDAGLGGARPGRVRGGGCAGARSRGGRVPREQPGARRSLRSGSPQERDHSRVREVDGVPRRASRAAAGPCRSGIFELRTAAGS